CQISWPKRELFLAICECMDRFITIRGFSFPALAELSPNEITLIYNYLDVITKLSHAGLNFIEFCRTPLETKQMLLKMKTSDGMRMLLKNNIKLETLDEA
ncbi:MAG: hypothetical protein LLG04_15765, partial [Parachlamydia sp.]|nr:hypothetical protein [Parachlamydia sp.]